MKTRRLAQAEDDPELNKTAKLASFLRDLCNTVMGAKGIFILIEFLPQYNYVVNSQRHHTITDYTYISSLTYQAILHIQIICRCKYHFNRNKFVNHNPLYYFFRREKRTVEFILCSVTIKAQSSPLLSTYFRPNRFNNNRTKYCHRYLQNCRKF